MKRLLTGLLAGVALLSLSAHALAVETVRVGEIEATRVVIAPPQNPLAKTVRDDLRAVIAEAPASSRAHTDAQQLYYFYGTRYFEPLWITQSAAGEIAFSDAAQDIIAVFEQAHLEGLNPDDYMTPDIDLALASTGTDALAQLETAFSAAVMRYAQDAYSGRLDPRALSANLDIDIKRVDEKALLENLVASADPASVLMALHPDHREFVALRALLAKHYDGSIEDQIVIADGKVLRYGSTDDRVPLLRARLELPAPEDEAKINIYDDALAIAVADFQNKFGLSIDGILGPATVAALNGEGGATEADIVANMERWRWMPEDLGDFNVFVNIPEFRVEVVKDDAVVWNSRTVVGTLQRQTPIFSDQIRHVVTNPYWNVPPTILRQDVMPRVVSNPGYLDSQNMELLYSGRVINAASVDWNTANPSQFRVRQRPGRSNALGQVKFLFPNKHDVYLHDTNAPALFDRSFRALSSGCVRVEDPFEFSRVLLEYETSFTPAAVEGSLGPSERWFTMQNRVPVHLAYFTLRVDPDGTVRSYGDLYGHNEAVIDALGL